MAGLSIFSDAVNTIFRAIDEDYAEAEARRGTGGAPTVDIPDVVSVQARYNVNEIAETAKTEKVLTYSAIALGALALFGLSN